MIQAGPPGQRYTEVMLSAFKRLDEVGFEKGRRALAALSLSFFVSIYLMVALNAPPGWGPAFLALAGCYVVAFLAVTADWFWGRWFASGLGWSGVMVAVISLVMMGWTPPLVIYGALHAIVVVALLGKKMAGLYDLQEGWRKRYAMDEFGVARLRKTITRASMSLPSLILWALGPKDPGQGAGLAFAAAGIGTLLLSVVGLRGLVRMRSWGLMALAASSAALWTLGSSTGGSAVAADLFPVRWFESLGFITNAPNAVGLVPTLAAAVLTLSLLPFARPVARFLRRRSA
jgi:hypothetical protein